MARRRPSVASVHADWLRLIETSGPFLSLPVLVDALGHGLDAVETDVKQRLRNAYEEWSIATASGGAGGRNRPPKATSSGGADGDDSHESWIKFVLCELLEHEDRYVSSYAEWKDAPKALRHHVDEHAEMLWPQLVIHESGEPDEKTSRLLVCIHPRAQKLEKGVAGSRWAASPQSRMAELCRATGVRLGLVTNGEQWCLVDAPRDETVGYATWYAQLWLDEPETFAAFRSLLGRHRFFAVGQNETLEALLTKSRENQHEVTDQLGLQVRRAVEMLVRTLDRADQDLGGELLKELEVGEIYEAAVTVMMRLVFLFSAEERGLLLLGDPLFDQYYAVSTLCEQLREVAEQHGEEILERRRDAWCRLLAAFRAVHSGVHHDRLQIPAYGGGLFDPDRFPFLEGRQKGTTWHDSTADPLPVDNRTVLHCLESLQYLQTKIGRHTESRRLSFRALDIEQIGHVYEGLLDHTAVRAKETTLGLYGKDGDEPEIELGELELLASQSRDKLVERLAKLKVKSSKRSVETLLDSELDADRIDQIRRTCGTDELWQRVEPFASLVRDDDFGHPIVILESQLFATAGLDRRSTGTHYTPRSLTEPIVEHTLEPLVYEGPAEGTPREKWKLRSPKEILDLKVCDMACGSGAFLVQACRYLGDRLVESWTEAEGRTPEPNPGRLTFPTIDYDGSPAKSDRNMVPKDPDERLLTARRLIAQRCLYGVDVNPVAAEMAKLSIWLLTLSKDKPFSFLDHAIRSGDSLLGIHDIRQLQRFSLDPDSEIQATFSSMPITELIEQASGTRLQIEQLDSDTIGHVRAQAQLLGEAETRTERLQFAADMLISGYIQPASNLAEREAHLSHAAVKAGQLSLSGSPAELNEYGARALLGRRPFHWCLEFPEVIDDGGFHAFIGNPPFMGGKQIPTFLGPEYSQLLKTVVDRSEGAADLVGYFIRRAFSLLRKPGALGLLATNSISETATRKVALDPIIEDGGTIIRACPNMRWPGTAAVIVTPVWISKGEWTGERLLQDRTVTSIDTTLSADLGLSTAHRLSSGLMYAQGTTVYGEAFIRRRNEVPSLIRHNPGLEPYLRTYVNGDVLNSTPECSGDLVVIDFGDRDEADIVGCDSILEELKTRVSAERANQTRQIHEHRPWLHWDKRTRFYRAARQRDRILACTIVSSYLSFRFVDPNYLFAHGLKLFLDDRNSLFGVLQSSIHYEWASAVSSSLGRTIRYSTSSCFDQFPFVRDVLDDRALADAGDAYHAGREQLCTAHECGPHQLYAQMHAPDDTGEVATELRSLTRTLDSATLDAFGWSDICPEYGHRDTKRGVRFAMDRASIDEILSRLLELNHSVHAQPQLEATAP